MSVKISTTNSKLGIIPSVNLPPVITCRKNCPCSKGCYALRGRYLFSNVKERHIHNYEAYMTNPAAYFEDIKKFINNGLVSYSYFRWHASGDIVDRQYFAGMVDVAKSLPRTSFLVFTKKFEIVNNYMSLNKGEIPTNLHVVFSAWGDDFRIVNPYKFPVAHVRFKDQTKNKNIPSTAVECSGNCQTCLQCWGITRGESVVFNQH